MNCDHCLQGKFIIGTNIRRWQGTWWFCRSCWAMCTATTWS